jgi:hypothetical protein
MLFELSFFASAVEAALFALNLMEPMSLQGLPWPRSVGSSARYLTIPLNARRAQAGKPVLIDRVLPGKKFLDRQGVAVARLFERKESAANRGDHFRLAANDPTLGSRRRQVGDRQRRAVWADDVFDPRPMGFSH